MLTHKMVQYLLGYRISTSKLPIDINSNLYQNRYKLNKNPIPARLNTHIERDSLNSIVPRIPPFISNELNGIQQQNGVLKNPNKFDDQTTKSIKPNQ